MISEAVRSTVAGEHTAAGFVMINTGIPGVEIITSIEAVEVHPAELVTVNVNTPAGRPVIVLLAPMPVVVTSPGERVIIHVPDGGNPLNTTLPVGTANVGCVIVPTTGAEGVAGCTGIITFADNTDIQPDSLVTVKLYVPDASPV
jgi:hypothetical protein